MSDLMDQRFAFLEKVIRSAGRLVKQGYDARTVNTHAMKGPQDFLTETDLASEAHIRSAIAEAFPDDSFFGEEGGGSVDGNVWVVDPIDGTANFTRGVDHFCISIGFVADGVPEMGAIYNPVTEAFYCARRGQGATLNGRKLGVSNTAAFSAASIELGWSPRISNERYLHALSELLRIGSNVRRLGSGAMALAHVADGRSDAYVELHMNSWDCVPGLLLVSEAGGAVCPYLALGDLRAGGPVLAATPALAEGISKAVGIPLRADPRSSVAFGFWS